MDISPYYGILFALAMAIFTALLSWKLSGEVFSETKFLRLVLASFALALGFNISGTPLANVAVNPFASALTGLLFSKGLNYIKEAPTQPDFNFRCWFLLLCYCMRWGWRFPHEALLEDVRILKIIV